MNESIIDGQSSSKFPNSDFHLGFNMNIEQKGISLRLYFVRLTISEN